MKTSINNLLVTQILILEAAIQNWNQRYKQLTPLPETNFPYASINVPVNINKGPRFIEIAPIHMYLVVIYHQSCSDLIISHQSY